MGRGGPQTSLKIGHFNLFDGGLTSRYREQKGLANAQKPSCQVLGDKVAHLLVRGIKSRVQPPLSGMVRPSRSQPGSLPRGLTPASPGLQQEGGGGLFGRQTSGWQRALPGRSSMRSRQGRAVSLSRWMKAVRGRPITVPEGTCDEKGRKGTVPSGEGGF